MKKAKKALVILTPEQLLHLQWIIRDLLKGKNVQMSDDEEDRRAGEEILKALEKAKRL